MKPRRWPAILIAVCLFLCACAPDGAPEPTSSGSTTKVSAAPPAAVTEDPHPSDVLQQKQEAAVLAEYPLGAYSNNENLLDFVCDVWLTVTPCELYGNRILRLSLKNIRLEETVYVGEDIDIQGIVNGCWVSLLPTGNPPESTVFRSQTRALYAGSSLEQVFHLGQLAVQNKQSDTRLRLVKSYVLVQNGEVYRRELAVSLPRSDRKLDDSLSSDPTSLGMQCDRTSYLAGETLQLTLTNQTVDQVISLSPYEIYIQKQTPDGWTSLPIDKDIRRHAEAALLDPQDSRTLQLTTEAFSAGHYRILKPYAIGTGKTDQLSQTAFAIPEAEPEPTVTETSPAPSRPSAE